MLCPAHCLVHIAACCVPAPFHRLYQFVDHFASAGVWERMRYGRRHGIRSTPHPDPVWRPHTVQSLAFVREETHSSLFEFVRETPGGAMPASHCRACCVLLALALPSVASIYTSQYSSQTAAWGSGSVGYGVVRRIPRSGGPLRAIRGGADTAGKAQVRDLAMNYSACIISVQPFCVSL